MAEENPGVDEGPGLLDGEFAGDRKVEDPELEAIKARVFEMEQEAEKLKEVQYQAEKQLIMSPQTKTFRLLNGVVETCAVAENLKNKDIVSVFNRISICACFFYPMTPEEKTDADNRSVYVGNVDYGATADELEIHFNGCGPVNRVTILCDKFTGHPKGFAYIEFSERDSVKTAMALDETLFRGRVIKVLPKRTNMPGISSSDRGGHRGGRSRGRGFCFSRYNSGFQARYRGRSSRSVLQSPLAWGTICAIKTCLRHTLSFFMLLKLHQMQGLECVFITQFTLLAMPAH
ncbi:PABP2 protein, partial [Atractosteus spatula]|nr:PABP2 protein [Atractosteus spatula]